MASLYLLLILKVNQEVEEHVSLLNKENWTELMAAASVIPFSKTLVVTGMRYVANTTALG